MQNAQMAMNDVPEFKGNVKSLRNDLLVDKAAEELFPIWQQNLKQWNKTGSDRPYHGSAIWYTRIGHAAGDAMIEMIKESCGNSAVKSPKTQGEFLRVNEWNRASILSRANG